MSILMDKLKQLITSKKFWTLVAAIVAALTAFFTTSCAASAKLQRSGVHIDTVRVDYEVKTRNKKVATAWFLGSSLPSKSFFYEMSPGGNRTSCSVCSSSVASLAESMVCLSNGSSNSPRFARMSVAGGLCSCSRTLLSSSDILPIYLMSKVIPVLSESRFSRSSTSSILIAMSVLAFPVRRSRRGGRRGKPRPKVKTVPLGGSHL